MAYNVNDRQRWLHDRLMVIDSIAINYRRPSEPFAGGFDDGFTNTTLQLNLDAICYEIKPAVLLALGIVANTTRRDYIIDWSDEDSTPSDYADMFNLPEQGDRIYDRDQIFVVTPLGDNLDVFHWTDNSRQAIRIHVSLINPNG